MTTPSPPTLYSIRGLTYRDNLFTADQETRVIDELNRLPLARVQMRGGVSLRLVKHYGWDYHYGGWKIEPAEPLPGFLEPIRERAATFAGIPASALEQILVSRYPPGSGIGWHRDAPMFGSPVVGVSFLGPCVMRFRRKKPGGYERVNIPLAPRSAYALSGDARHDWQHSIVGAPRTRYSITFRTLVRKSAA